jgi:tRNA(adenine34) deaminase
MPATDEDFMRLAIAEARAAEAAGEVPVGAIIVSSSGEVIGRGNNRVLRDSDPTAHAEVIAMRDAGRALGNYRLLTTEGGCTLYVTLEPCAMCAGAILHGRINRLVFAAFDPKAGACGSALKVMNHKALNHKVEVTSGILDEECGRLLRHFFRLRRKRPAQTADAQSASDSLTEGPYHDNRKKISSKEVRKESRKEILYPAFQTLVGEGNN